jgi:hypothetical protein
MTYRPSTLSRGVALVLLAGVLVLADVPFGASASAAELKADFHFNDTRTAPTGQTMADIGTGNAFAAAFVDGAVTSRQVLAFPGGNGLSLGTAGLAESGSYSVVLLVRLDSAAPGRRKLLDFAAGSSDAGLYLCDGRLLIELLAATPCFIGPGFAGEWAQVAITRDHLTDEVRAYLGDDQPSAADPGAALALGSELRFFRDDDQLPADEHSGGAVARIRVYDGVLSAAEVAGLDRVDTTAPSVGLSGLPAATNDSVPTFSGGAGTAAGDLGDVTLKIYAGSTASGAPVDSVTVTRSGGSWSADAPTPLEDATYTAQAEQLDAAGNLAVSETRTFTVDTIGAGVSLDTPASGTATNDSTPTYSGAAGNAPDDSASVAVRIRSGTAASGHVLQTLTATRSGASWAVDGSPPLDEGTYTAEAEQSDSAGNVDLSDPVTFTVDLTRPQTSLGSGPPVVTNDTTPEFTFSSQDADQFVCRLYRADDASPPGFAECSSPRVGEPLADGSYVFDVAAVDAAGNQDDTPETRAFRIDTVAPRTTIVVGPADTTGIDAAFVFTANEAATFSCRLDDSPWQPCASPQSYRGLALGPHRFEVRGSDTAGNQEPGPASHAWQVLKPGLRIPAAVAQAIALAREIVQLRNTFKRLSLRRIARRRTIRLTGFDALTAGRVDLRVRALLRRRPRGRIKRVRVAAARHDLAAAGRYPLRAVVTKRGRQLARRRAKLRVELVLTFTDLAGRSLRATMKTTMVR